MEPAAILLGLVVLCLLTLAPVFGIIFWIRMRALERGVQVPSVQPAVVVQPPPLPKPEATPVPARAPEPAPEPAPTPAPEPAPAPVPVPVPVPEPAPVPRAKIEWERWLGVRGAAVLGGIFLAVAGVLFFQYSIQHGLITKEMRVLLGVVVGSGAMFGGQLARRRGYEMAGNAITGAGAVILYAAFWAAHALGILPALVCFAAMAAVTVLSCWLSFRVGSQLIAWLGLTGGFATPLLVNTGADRPIGLFAYVLVLDLGFLFIAGKRRWPLLGLWGLAGSFGILALWIVDKMDPYELPIALVVLGLLALLFVGASALAGRSERGRWVLSQTGAVLVPFLFALYFASQSDLGYNLWPLALLGALLAGASIWLARMQGAALVPTGAAAGAGAIALVWVLSHNFESERVWELVVCALGTVALFAAGREWRRARLAEEVARGLGDAWLASCGGFALVGFAACAQAQYVEPWPFLVLFLGLALALVRVAADTRLRFAAWAAAPLATFGLLWWVWMSSGVIARIDTLALLMLVAVMLGLLFAAIASFGRAGYRAGFLGIAAGSWIAILLALVISADDPSPNGLRARLPLLLFASIGCFAATAAGSWTCVLLSALACAAGQNSVALWNSFLRTTWNDELVGALLALAVLGSWLPLTRARWGESRGVWIAASVIPLLWVFDVGNAVEELHGPSARFWIPLPFALMEFAIAAHLRRKGEPRGALWPLLAGIVCAAAILPLWVDRNALVVWCALAAAGAAWLGRGREFRPAQVVACGGALVGTFVSLLVEGDGTFKRAAHVLWDTHAWEYLVPALALVWAGAQSERAARILCVVCGLLLGLFWITIEVHQAYAPGEHFSLFFPHDQAREVAVSVAWAVYALALLALGMRRKQSGLRWASLVLLVIVIGKLFLFDLSELQGLYRVASFLGLAVSLLLVSFGYQRFVFRKSAPSEGA